MIAAVLIFFPSCSKDDSGEIPKEDLAIAQDEAYVDALFDAMDNMALEEVVELDDDDYGFIQYRSNISCYSVTVNSNDTVTFPKIVTIDFGEGCTYVYNGDTITRSGKVIITLTNRWFVLGAQHIITFDNFYFNGVKIEGTRTITNNGINDKNRFESSVALENGRITFDADTYITRTSNHVREWSWHLNPMNDTIYVSGSASGTNILGENYQRHILEPLVYVRCPEIFSWGLAGGKLEIINETRGNMTIEHTGDACSGEVIVEKDGNRYTYTFKYRYKRNN